MKSRRPPPPAPSELPLLHISGCTLKRRKHRKREIIHLKTWKDLIGCRWVSTCAACEGCDYLSWPGINPCCQVTRVSQVIGLNGVWVICVSSDWTFDFLLVLLWPVKVHGGCISIQRVDGVWVSQQLWQERLKDVGQIWEESRERQGDTSW